MEGLAPPLELLIAVRRAIEEGQSIKQGISRYIQSSEDEFSLFVTRWLNQVGQGRDVKDLLQVLSSPYRRALLLTLHRGLMGEPIYPILCLMEQELIEACYEEINQNIAKLPFYLMVPLLLFQFPAFLLLLFGPIIQNFFTSFAGQ